jgi:hypothetical protein
MSEEDRSGDNKSFLARWSQRKHEAKQPGRDAPVANPEVPSEPVTGADAEPEFDLSSLPKLEDMTATTNITAFLRKGVPEHLRNAALRQSWALDPAVRNYVNPALDYAYDWNTPGGVPGSSEIGTGMDVARLASQVMGGVESVADPSAGDVEPIDDRAQSLGHHAKREPEPELPVQAVRLESEAGSTEQAPADAEKGGRTEAERTDDIKECSSVAPQRAVRRHGSAKPQV